jgi:aminotransferase
MNMRKILVQTNSIKANLLKESMIREVSRMAVKYDVINLGQGVPDFPCPVQLKQAVSQALDNDINQYAVTWGDKNLREALSKKYSVALGFSLDPETEITVTCGATEALIAALIAVVDPGDEVIIFEPFYENYLAQIILSDAVVRTVPLQLPSAEIDHDKLQSAFTKKTKAIIVNTPNNPTGKVFSLTELKFIADLCQKNGVLLITDEIYEHILFDDVQHVYPASLADMRDLTITISGLSKTYSLTGWRIGWVMANEKITNAIRKVHDFLTIGAPAPLQKAAVIAVSFGQDYYKEVTRVYAERRNHLLETLDGIAMPYFKPQGAYYVFAEISKYGYKSDLEFLQFMLEKIGVAIIPGSTFLSSDNPKVNGYARFCFSRKMTTLQAAREKLWQNLKI